MKLLSRILCVVTITAILFNLTACNDNPDPLPSWNDGTAKSQIISFVSNVTDKASSGYIPPEKRIVVSDLDGTLLLENTGISVPGNAQIELIKLLISELRTSDSPEDINARKMLDKYNSFIAEVTKNEYTQTQKDGEAYMDIYYELEGAALQGMTTEEAINSFSSLTDHQFSNGLTFKKAFYEPMIELYRYLIKNDFKFYVVSGSNNIVIYSLCRDVLTIDGNEFPFSNCIGTDLISAQSDTGNNRLEIIQTPDHEKINLHTQKCISISEQIGYTPVMAIGNSLGDMEMLNWTLSDKSLPAISLLINHDDEIRELSYSSEDFKKISSDNGWLCVSMQNDFSKIFG